MTLIVQLLSAFLLGIILVVFTVPSVVRISNEKKLFDYPNERKVNKTPIPNLGGISLFIGITMATTLTLGKLDFPEYKSLSVALIIMLFVGIWDDISIMHAKTKFVFQIISALILIYLGDVRFTNLHGIFGINEINYEFSLFISLLAIVGIMNALNFIDGIDGLAASMGLIISTSFGVLFLILNQPVYSILCFAITGSLVVFFFYNVFGKKNKIFMGDTGSLLIGLLTAFLVIKFNELALTQSTSFAANSPTLSLAIISIPLIDMIRVFAIRIIQKKSPMFPDKNHIHHKLLQLGYSHLRSTTILAVSNIMLIGLVMLMNSLNNNVQTATLLLVAFTISSIPELLIRYNNVIIQNQLSNSILNEFKASLKKQNPLNDLPKVHLNIDKKEKELEEATI